jgi:drug/metabolite transporter (DMT)-like permease
MNGVFCSYGRREDYATDEAYRKIVKRKAIASGVIMILGLVTIAADLAAHCIFRIAMTDYMSGFLLGMGTGLFFAGGLLMAKRLMQLKSEKKLKEARIEESDERNRAVSDAALRIATLILLAAMYIVMIVAMFSMQELVRVLCLLICAFLAVYFAVYKILQRKM